MKYLLDTNICSYILRGDESPTRRMFAEDRANLMVSVIVESELRAGLMKKGSAKSLRLLDSFLAPLMVLEFTRSDAAIYAELRSKLERKGKPVGANDMLIAAQALGRGLVLATNNVREFSVIEGLRLENWV
ncbi:MAG: type II toxin-antitoxin system VapC family toxin [Myxococcaceae bacterium]